MSTSNRFAVRALCILWPSFLMAGVLEMLVFSVVDPGSLQWFGGAPVEWSSSAVYTLAFFVFWAVISTAGALTQMLITIPSDDDQPVRRSAPRWPQ
ncbi:MAG: hypothetical protein C4K60_18200 [Ideonella sp. MAG2]|nr:MAG: hypothetical protein C4K60_18200 [Ideonella sp. MAG2]